MNILIDWYSYTAERPIDTPNTGSSWARFAKWELQKAVGHRWGAIFWNGPDPAGGDSWIIGKARPPYTHSVKGVTNAIVGFVHRELSHVLVEIPGRGCRYLEELEVLHQLIEETAPRATRIDVTADIVTDETPITFSLARTRGRVTHYTTIDSDVGQTVYLGSPMSERRAVVYRYKAPHPRAGFLRVEHRYRGGAAKMMAAYYLAQGLQAAIKESGLAFGWQSDSWTPTKVSYPPPDPWRTDEAGRSKQHWLISQVFPAMRRYEADGLIGDLREFVHEFLFESSAVEDLHANGPADADYEMV